MDAQLKAKWVEALRSGDFKQAQGVLHDAKTDSYCCLGVLCKVVGAEWGEFDKEVDDYIVTKDHVPVKDGELLGDTDGEELEPSACMQFGIRDQSIFIGMNDGSGREGEPGYEPPKTFSEIADYIEKNL
jgi:hypothetical protein